MAMNEKMNELYYYSIQLKCSQYTGLTISSETLYFVDCESADGKRENNLGSNERYIH